MGWRQIEGMGEILADRHCSQKQSQSGKTSSALKKNRLSNRQAPWYLQINSLQGHQKRGSVIHVPPSFLLNVNLLTNLPMGPNKGTLHCSFFHTDS